jgi:hypothetical protein
MLLFLQFVAIAVVNSTNVSSMVVRNYQTSTELKLASHKIINYVLTNKDYFVNYSAYLNSDGEFDIPLNSLLSPQINARIISFKCLDTGPFQTPLDCNMTNQYWQLIVSVEDFKSQTSIEVMQGIVLSLGARNTLNKTQQLVVKKAWWYRL